MVNADIIIIGAGASGLNAGRILSRKGKKILMLEARDRIGGRIFTLESGEFSQPVEMGAEFIHGNLRTTRKLLHKAKIRELETAGDFMQVQHGEVKPEEVFGVGWDVVVKKLKKLKQDLSMDEFLQEYFSDEKYTSLRNSLKRYVQGYDAADTSRASAFAIRDEMMGEDRSSQFRVEGGYQRLMNFLADEIRQKGGEILLSKMVKEVKWKKNEVQVITETGEIFSTEKIILTIPLGVLQAISSEKAAITFTPAIPDKIKAAKQMGNGFVIKTLLEFDEPFWKKLSHHNRSMKSLSFIFSKTVIPTWWTQFPEETALITGWLAGPKSEEMTKKSDEELLETSIESLSYIFQIPAPALQQKLKAWRIANWNADPFSLGAYSYGTVETKKARKVLSEPERETVFFSGEALYGGSEMGTVEAAFKSGEAIAKQVLKLYSFLKQKRG